VVVATLKKPQLETLSRLNNKYKKDPFDIQSLTNKIENQYTGLNDRLASAAGGDASALRSSLLGAQVGKTQAISDAYLQAESINRADRLKEQDFNLGIDRFNVGQDNLEKDIRAKDRAAYDNNKSKLLAAIGTDLGNIGKEGVTKKQAEQIFGYDWKGRYKADNPDASDEEVDKAFRLELFKLASSENAYGGYLKKKK